MTMRAIAPAPTPAGRAFLIAWAQELGTGNQVSIRELAALPAATALMPTGDLRELGTWLWRNADSIPGFRARHIRRGVSQRNARGEASYFWRPAIWALEVVAPREPR